VLDVLRQLGFRPYGCVWELTLACNMRCKHCGSIAGEARTDELSLEECLAVADQLAALGCRRLTLGGGEPTLRRGWDEIAHRLTAQGVRVNMISNGWSWTGEQLERARRARLASVGFSLDGHELDHDHLRREGSFRRVLEAIDLSVAAGVPTAVNTTINRRNARGLPELRRLLADHGVFSWQLQLATPTGNLASHRELVIDAADLLWLVPQIAELRAELGAKPEILPGDDVGYYGRCERDLRDRAGAIPFWIGCRGGCQMIGIESNGDVKGCLSLPSSQHGVRRFSEGSLRQQTLAEIWNRPGAFAYNRAFREEQLAGFCAICRYRSFCRGGCTWTTFSHSGERRDNPYCFYRQAVEHARLELLDEEPTADELAFFSR
jgi:radical SAM protein with 4Fe4S-binding SPASM domain